MKVLYIGCYRDGTGWAQAAIDYILSMDAAGIDVVPRPVKLNSRQVDLPERIIELEKKADTGCNICIQHVLPHMMDFNGRFEKNIALYATETSNFKRSIWSERINQMDEAWVINNEMKLTSESSGVNIPIKVVPHACNVSKFRKKYQKLQIPPDEGESFVFYTIGEFNRRKNFSAFIKAFHTEFSPEEPVSILIKTHQYGVSPETLLNQVTNMCNDIKEALKIHPSSDDYIEDLIVTDYLHEEQVMSLHNSCDCFVMPSYGEAWCIPAFDAMGFGNTPICTNVGGMSDFLADGGGILVDGREEPVFGMTDTFNDIYTAKENWISINPIVLQNAMRRVYNLWQQNDSKYNNMQKQGIASANDYSYSSVGQKIRSVLENGN